MSSKRKVEFVGDAGRPYDGSGRSVVDSVVRAINRLDTSCPDVHHALDILVDECDWLTHWRYAEPKGRPVELGDKVRISFDQDDYSEGRVYKITKHGVRVVRTYSTIDGTLGGEVFWDRYPDLTHADGTPIDWDATEVCDD